MRIVKSHLQYINVCSVHGSFRVQAQLIRYSSTQFVISLYMFQNPDNKNLDFSLENLNLAIFSFLLFPGRFSRIFVLALAMNQKICACFSWEKKF